MAQDIFNLNATFEDVYPTAVGICVRIVDELKLHGDYMCPGLISAYGPPVRPSASLLNVNL